jgi:hypothetical protein
MRGATPADAGLTHRATFFAAVRRLAARTA